MVARLGRHFFSVGLMLIACAGDEREGERQAERCAADDDCASGVCDPTSKTCVECLRADDCKSGAVCKNRECVPRVRCKNSFDCSAGQVCGRDEGYCAECFLDTDCPDDGGCVNEECRPRCESDKDCVELELLCDFERTLCVDCVDDRDCPGSDHCAGGACMPDVCLQGASSCSADGSEARTCSSNGSSELYDPCGLFERCVEGAGFARCEPLFCEPESLFCDASSASVRRCSEDGFEAEVVEDCKAQGKACFSGACEERVCVSGGRVCIGANVYECNASETKLDLVDTCDEGSYCDPAMGGCVAGSCTPGHKSCSSGHVIVCNAKGSAYEDAGACDEDESCYLGACVQKTCEAGKVFCRNGHPWTCDANGSVAGQADTCTSLEFCDVATGSCQAQVCTPKSKVCSANGLRTCDALGSSYTVEDCGSDRLCFEGQCHPKICEPNKYFCAEDGNPYRCNDKGIAATLQSTCDPSEICKVVSSGSGAFCTSGAGGQGGESG